MQGHPVHSTIQNANRHAVTPNSSRRQAGLLSSSSSSTPQNTNKMATRRYARSIPATNSLSRSTIALSNGSISVSSTRANATSASNQAEVNEKKNTLSWSDYLKIRGQKRRWELATTIPITSAAAIGGMSYFGVHAPNFLGFDPLALSAAATASVTGLGYLVGPMVGSQMWRLTHRKTMSLIEDKETLFHQHIKRNRVDPSTQSATNPVPDFYGEKIGSMKQYRQWLRDQARYRKKAGWGSK